MDRTTTADVDYPSSDGKPMAETIYHIQAMILLYEALQDFFKSRENVFIFMDQFWYWEKGNNKARIAPDVMVVTGTKPLDLDERRSFYSWKEPKAVPAAVFEMASAKTWRADLGQKYQRYEALGVREYVLFDPEGVYLTPQLQGYRLQKGRFRPLPDGEIASQLGFRIEVEGKMLRLIDSRTGQRILTRQEAIELQSQLREQEKQRADREAQLHEQEKQRADREAQLRNAAEQENARLKAILQEYGHVNGSNS